MFDIGFKKDYYSIGTSYQAYTGWNNKKIRDIVQRQLYFFGMPDEMSGQINVSLTLSIHRNFQIHVRYNHIMQSLITLYAITMLKMA